MARTIVAAICVISSGQASSSEIPSALVLVIDSFMTLMSSSVDWVLSLISSFATSSLLS